MICITCNYDNTETFPMVDGIIYCYQCGEALTDCCFCGSRKGVVKAKDYDSDLDDDSLLFCEVCKDLKLGVS